VFSWSEVLKVDLSLKLLLGSEGQLRIQPIGVGSDSKEFLKISGHVGEDSVFGSFVLAETGLLFEAVSATRYIAEIGPNHGVDVDVLLQVLLLGKRTPADFAAEALDGHVDGHEVSLEAKPWRKLLAAASDWAVVLVSLPQMSLAPEH
jgi:hypothetical protein